MSSTDTPAGAPGIVVGVDGSPSSGEALRWATRQARLTGQTVAAVIAWDYPVNYGVTPLGDFDWEANARDALGKAVSDALEPDDAARVVQRVVEGHPSQVLLDASEDAGLVVVGCRGRGGFSGLLLGSVSQHVVAHAHCPVLVVHEHDRAPAPQAG